MPALLLLLVLAAPPSKPPVRAPTPAMRSAYCSGTYADDFAARSKATSAAADNFTYCVRSTAIYECLSYSSDGAVKRTKKEATFHGTAFAYKRVGQDTLLLTNMHVVETPAVTDEEHVLTSVPPGCKRVSETLKIVDGEKDAFETDDVTLSRVASDPSLDMEVLKSKAPLNVMPWKIGRSSALRERNVVEVRGFPLGAFKATVEGRVTSPYDHDEYKDWDHDDFVVDAQLSGGNSGSPVLAVSCATGEYELVGVYHANYSRGSSMNVVVHSDQLRELMTTLKRSTPLRSDQVPLTAQSRRRLMDDAAELGHLYLPFGAVSAQASPREDGALLYSVYDANFPLHTWPVFVLEDLDASSEGGFGREGRIWFGNARGLRERSYDDLDENERLAIDRTLDTLRRNAILVTAHRRAKVRAETSREAAQDVTRLEKDVRRATSQSRDLAQGLVELAEKHSPTSSEAAVPPMRPFIHAEAPEAAAPTAPAAP